MVKEKSLIESMIRRVVAEELAKQDKRREVFEALVLRQLAMGLRMTLFWAEKDVDSRAEVFKSSKLASKGIMSDTEHWLIEKRDYRK